MKKIIAISVMFALVIGAAFADVSVSGGYHMSFDLAVDKVQGNGEDVGMGRYGAGGDVGVSAEGDNAGGKLRIWGDNYHAATGIGDHALVWWKPIDQLKIQLGGWDGDWGHNQIIGWGFTEGAKDTVALETRYAGDKAPGFWGGFNQGLSLFISPADGIEIDIGIPVGRNDSASKPYSTAVIFSNTKINVKADIPNIGTAKFALALNKGDLGTDTSAVAKDAELITDIYVAFYLSALESSGMGAELGLGVTTSGTTGKKNDKIDLGVGFKYEAGDLGLKAGLGVGFGDANKVGTKTLIPLSVQVLPYYNLGALTAYLNAGFDTKLGADDTVVSITFNPYVKVPISGGNFWAGVKFFNSGVKGADAQWSIPIGFNYGF